MEPYKNEKPTDWEEIKTKILYTIMCLFPIISAPPIIFYSEKIAKLTNTTSAQVKDVGILFIILIEIIFLWLTLKDTEEYESSKPNKKDDVTCIELEVQGRKYTITKELYNLLGKRGVPTLGEVRSLPPNPKRISQTTTHINHSIKEKENTTSRVTPFPTKQETPKRANKESMREFIENHIQRMDDLDYIAEEIEKHKYPITPELKSLLRNRYRNKNLRKDFDDYIRNNPPEGFTVETFDLTKNINQPSVAPGTNPVLSDLINQIQTHGDNIVVKQQGQQLTIKATLNQNSQNKNDQWGNF